MSNSASLGHSRRNISDLNVPAQPRKRPCALRRLKNASDGAPLELLEVFVPDRPLDQEEFEEWIEINSLSAEEVKEAAREAVRRRWVEDTPDGLLLTASGRDTKFE